MPDTVPTESHSIDALLPGEMARKAERIGAAKTRQDVLSLLALGVLAGAFIAFGGIFSTIVAAGAAGELPFGVVRLLSGLVFSLGLILVVVGGAELFTGNNLIVMAWAGGKVGMSEMLRAWAIVYVGNFIGAAATAIMIFLAGTYALGNGAVGAAALATAEAKAALPFTEALFRGILCNVLVCLAVWLSYAARSATGKLLCVIFPVAAFVALGFEHSVANLFLFPLAILSGLELTLGAMLGNLVPVILGNIVGGGGLVGLVYWSVYGRGAA